MLQGCIDLEGTVWETDLVQPTWHKGDMPSGRGLKPGPPSQLHESLAGTPLPLGDQRASQLCKGVGPDIIERRENAFAIIDRERDDLGFKCERLLEQGACRLIHESDDLADVLVGDPQTGEIHGGERTPKASHS